MCVAKSTLVPVVKTGCNLPADSPPFPFSKVVFNESGTHVCGCELVAVNPPVVMRVGTLSCCKYTGIKQRRGKRETVCVQVMSTPGL